MACWSSPTSVPNDLLQAPESDRDRINTSLTALCEEATPFLAPKVAEAVRYSLVGEGKRVRGFLVLHAYRACGGVDDAVYALAAAVEVVHAYSLVHDDLPCMDDDDVRRGRPTVHRVYGVAVAACAGLAMVPLAARCAYRGGLSLGLPPAGAADIVRELMRAAGAGGMIGGQLLDLQAEGVALPLDELERVHRAKTGALILVAARAGAIAARGDARQLAVVERYGSAIGLAFQIMDDVLD